MVFSSLTFLFIFLPIVLLLYFIVNDKYKNYILLFFSLLFYSWGEPKYVLLMIVSIVVNYVFAKFIDKTNKKIKRKSLLIVSILFNVGLLFYFKYLNFTLESINNIFNTSIPIHKIILPIGISFYTFQILSYVIDVYRKKVKVQNNIFVLGTYISFFPQLIAGPIVRYETIEKQLLKRNHSIESFCKGFKIFIIGLSKKVLIANNVAFIADTIFNNYSNQTNLSIVLVFAVLAYTLQIYYDFSGYSDMAIGLGKIFGFDFDENFNYPYISTSITDFWKRWHISLSTWFKDYVYIPLGGNKCSKIKWVRNFVIVWLLTGIWHGANWNFIIWGIYYCVILLLEKVLFKGFSKYIPKIIRWLYAFILINFGWLIFRIENLNTLTNIFMNIIRFNNSGVKEFILNNYSLLDNIAFFMLGIIFMFPIAKILKKYQDNTIIDFALNVILIALFVLSICCLINNSYNPFIYFRF